MSELNHVFDGTRNNFQQLVVENSQKGAVLVNYWTPGAGPCFKLWQDLEVLVEQYQGRFLLVNVNTDSQGSLARENGITSVPTIKIYHLGKIVESIHGAESRNSLRRTIDKYVPPAQNSAIAKAIQAYQDGHADNALTILIEASSKNPEDAQVHAMTMKLLLREKRYEEIERIYSVLPGSIQAMAEIAALRVHAKMLRLAEQAPPVEQLDKKIKSDPDNKKLAMQRAAIAMTGDDFETALQQLLKITQQDRHYLDDLPRKAMLVIFSLLGDQHTLTRRFQNALRESLH